jgi:hypothetical protein
MTVGLSTPKVVYRDARSYLGINAVVTMANIDETVQVLIGEVLIEVGVPVGPGTAGDDRAVAGVLPAGRYLTATHTGPYGDLEPATGAFRAWASEHGYVFDVRPGDGGEVWGCRLEHYPTDPAKQPDPARWETVLEFRLRD